MTKHHIIAVTLAGIMTALIAVDAVVRATTGHASLITDDARGPAAAGIAMSIMLGLTFAACAFVLHREAPVFAGTRGVVRGARKVAIAGLVISAAGQIAIHPVEVAVGLDPDGAWAAVSGSAALVGLLVTFLSALVVGIASLRRNQLGVGGRLLSLLLPVVAVTAVLAALAPAVASPVLCTAVVVLGFATIGVHATSPAHARAGAAPLVA